jgi:hypothetical protein
LAGDDGITAKTPDGVVHQFPAGTPDSVIDGAIKTYLGSKDTDPRPGAGMPIAPANVSVMQQTPEGRLATGFKSYTTDPIKSTWEQAQTAGNMQGGGIGNTIMNLPGTLIDSMIGAQGNQLQQFARTQQANERNPSVLGTARTAAEGTLAALPVVGPMIRDFATTKDPLEQVGKAGGILAADAAGKIPGKVAGAPDAMRRGIQESLNIGPDLTARAVAKYNSDLTDAITQRSDKMAEVKFDHQQEVQNLMSSHKADTQDALIAQAKQIQEINQKYNDKLSKIDADHSTKVNTINRANELEQKQAATRTQLEGEAKQVQEHLSNHLPVVASEALADAKAAYPKISGTVPSEELNGMVRDSLQKLQGSTAPPTSLKTVLDKTGTQTGKTGFGTSTGPSIGGRHFNLNDANDLKAYQNMKAQGVFTPEEIGRMEGTAGKDIPFDQLHGHYSEIGKELGNPNLPGDTRAALSDAYAKIGNKMRSLAESEGKGEEFQTAQAKYKDVMQTFYNHKPLSQGGSPIAKALQAIDPNYPAETGPFASRSLTGPLADKAIAQLGKFTAQGARPELIRMLNEKLNQIDALPSSAKFKETPAHPGYPAKPSTPEAKVPDVPAKLSQAVKIPGAKLPTEVDPQALKAQTLQSISNNLRGTGGLRLSLDLLSIMRAIKTGNPSMLMYPIGRRVAGRALQNPATMDWLTQPTPEEIRSLPDVPRITVNPKSPSSSPSAFSQPPSRPSMKTGEGTSAAQMTETPPKSNPSQEAASKSHDLQRLRDVLNNPKATAEEKSYARTVLEGEK